MVGSLEQVCLPSPGSRFYFLHIKDISFNRFNYNKTPKYLMSLIAEGDGDDHYKWKKLVHHHRPLLPFLEPFDQNVFVLSFLSHLAK